SSLRLIGKPIESEHAPGCDAMLSGSHFDRWKLRWKEPHLLDLEYLSGHISGYNSNWSSQQVENGDYRVELRLTPLTDGFLELKPGGGYR
ncbi:MAG: hypothetical protein QM757_27125, partial [Paludibaculum sp.]